MARFVFNPFRQAQPDWSAPALGFLEGIRDGAQRTFHRSLPGYAPTPLRPLPQLAAELGLGSLRVKDESGRFGIKAFKGLGASYAIYRLLAERWRERNGETLTPERFRDEGVRAQLGAWTFAAATDGNHGRAVAWTARMLGQRAVIFLPADTAPARFAAIEAEGAEARAIEGTFDDCVRVCAETSAREGWQVVADTAYPGYEVVPGFIMTGYATIFEEIAEQTSSDFDAIFLPAGVGGLAAAGAADAVFRRGAERPALVCVEPESSACFLESVAHGTGEPVAATGDQQSLMVGLCCGMPSLLAWPVIRDAMDLFLAIDDGQVPVAMRRYAREGVTAGESGSSTLAGLLDLCRHPALAEARARLGLGPDSRVLVVNTEGDTDPENYARVMARGAEEGA